MATARQTTERRPQQQAAAQQPPASNLPTEQPRKVHPLVAFKEYAEARAVTLHNALPPHISPNAFMSVVLTALQKKPELLKCTQQSLWNACIDAANAGLLPDGTEGAIAPYGQNDKGTRVAEIATFMPMIGGYRKLAYEGGLIASWEVNVVRQRDHFDFALGDDAYIVHRPYFGAEDPGGVVGAYSVCKLKDGAVLRDVMGLFDLNRIKAKSKASKGPWSDPAFEPEMHRKTMGRRHYKQLPKTPALSRLIERDNADFDLDSNTNELIEQRQQRRLTSTSETFDRFAAIDHEPTPNTGTDEDVSAAFDDDQDGDQQTGGEAQHQPKEDPKPDTGKKEDPISTGPQGGEQSRGNTAAAAEAEKVTSTDGTATKDRDAPDGGKAADADKPAEGPTGSAPEPSENDERRWPNGLKPEDAEEYEHYLDTKLGDFTVAADVSAWWKSADEADLRSACKVSKAQFDAFKKKAEARYSALLKAAKAK